MKAFVLCKLVPGKEQQTIQSIRGVEGVTDVYVTFGGWDAILSAEADTIDKLSSLIINKVRLMDGVTATETLVTTNI